MDTHGKAIAPAPRTFVGYLRIRPHPPSPIAPALPFQPGLISGVSLQIALPRPACTCLFCLLWWLLLRSNGLRPMHAHLSEKTNVSVKTQCRSQMLYCI